MIIMGKLTVLLDSLKAYRAKNGFPPLTEEEEQTFIPVDEKQAYMKKYYEEHKDKIKENQREWYQKNKNRLLTKTQKELLEYYRNHTSWEIPMYVQTAHDLKKPIYAIHSSTMALLRKWYLERWVTGLIFLAWTIDDTFSEDDAVYENVNLEDENKTLRDENAILQRRLQNAEDRYMKLLGEYTEYKENVQKAYIDLEDEERNFAKAIWTLDLIVMNR